MRRKNRRGASAFLTLVMLAVFLGAIFFGTRVVLQSLYPMKYVRYVEKYAEENQLDLDFVYAVIKAESGFDPEAVSSVGAKGLMQLTPETFSWLQTKTGEELPEDALFDPETNIRYGTFLLGILQKKHSGQTEILCGYHAGIGITKKWLEDPKISGDGKTLDHIPYDDTRVYVSRVQDNIKIYNWLYEFENGGQGKDEKK